MDHWRTWKHKNGRNIKFQEVLREKWLWTERYFECKSGKDLGYVDLVGAHVAQAVRYPKAIRDPVATKAHGWMHNKLCPVVKRKFPSNAPRTEKERIRVIAATSFYVDSIPKAVGFVGEKVSDNSATLRDAWWTMILQAMFWHRAVSFKPLRRANFGGHTVPSQFWDSRESVYIA